MSRILLKSYVYNNVTYNLCYMPDEGYSAHLQLIAGEYDTFSPNLLFTECLSRGPRDVAFGTDTAAYVQSVINRMNGVLNERITQPPIPPAGDGVEEQFWSDLLIIFSKLMFFLDPAVQNIPQVKIGS